MYTGIIFLFQPLTVTQIKKVQSLIQESNDRCAAEMKECETVRHQHLVQIGNTLHPRVPISNDEVSVCVWVCVWNMEKNVLSTFPAKILLSWCLHFYPLYIGVKRQ